MDCHWGFALRKIFYQEWCVSTNKTRTLELGLMRMVLYELFLGVPKVIFDFSSVRSSQRGVVILIFFMGSDCVPPYPISPSLCHRRCVMCDDSKRENIQKAWPAALLKRLQSGSIHKKQKGNYDMSPGSLRTQTYFRFLVHSISQAPP